MEAQLKVGKETLCFTYYGTEDVKSNAMVKIKRMVECKGEKFQQLDQLEY